jgi:esterase/lipase
MFGYFPFKVVFDGFKKLLQSSKLWKRSAFSNNREIIFYLYANVFFSYRVCDGFKKSFPKNYDLNELEMRKNAFSYNRMPSKALNISLKLSKKINKDLHKINCPTLILHGKHEKLGDYKNVVSKKI